VCSEVVFHSYLCAERNLSSLFQSPGDFLPPESWTLSPFPLFDRRETPTSFSSHHYSKRDGVTTFSSGSDVPPQAIAFSPRDRGVGMDDGTVPLFFPFFIGRI